MDEVGHLLNRDEAKFIKKSRPLSNAMMRYGFTKALGPDGVDGSNPWNVMDAATLRVLWDACSRIRGGAISCKGQAGRRDR